MKICITCKQEKENYEFHKNPYGKDGLRNECKYCISIKQKNYHILNKEKNNLKSNNYYIENTSEVLRKSKVYRDLNKTIISRKAYIKRKMNKLHNFSCSLRSLISSSFKNKNFKKGIKSKEILGCTLQEFRNYIESKFESWMNWNNYGGINIKTKNTNWDLDHIIPLDSAKTQDDIIKLNHYTNFQPLCSYTNRYIKKNKHEK